MEKRIAGIGLGGASSRITVRCMTRVMISIIVISASVQYSSIEMKVVGEKERKVKQR
jgi:hypothetical protein